MSEFNFDNMKNVDIPDSWIDGALNVPPDTEHPVPFLKHSKVIAFAASIVLVCSLSVVLFFVTNDNPVVPPIKYDKTEYNTFAHEKESTCVNSENEIPKTESDKKSSEISQTDSKTVFESMSDNKTEKPTRVESSFAPLNTEKAEKPTNMNETKPESVPTSKPEKPKPTQKEEKPTTIPVTEKPESTEVRPDGPAIEGPEGIESYLNSYESGVITAKIHKNDFSEIMYCGIYDNSGNILGDSNLFSNSKKAEFVMNPDGYEDMDANYNIVEYNTNKLGTPLRKGSYKVVFYSKNDTKICEGYIYVTQEVYYEKAFIYYFSSDYVNITFQR